MTLGYPANSQIRSVQALRAIAALFVVAFHATVLWHDKFDLKIVPWENGNAGVDLFFVISGFIMVLSSQRLLERSDGWHRFITSRLVRIVPMYWLVTAAKLVAIAMVPAMALHTRPTAWNALASFLFLPSRDAVGAIRPILDIAWTLSFEMMFYIAFAAALFCMIDAFVVVAPAMIALALTSLAVRPGWPAITTLANPIVLEFVLGLVVGRSLINRNSNSSPAIWLVFILAGLACLGFVQANGTWLRPAIWGSAASVALGASVICEPWLGNRLPRLAIQVGEASYSLYLTHGFVLPLLGVAVGRSHLTGKWLGGVLVASSLVVSTMVALLIYQFIEVPMTTWFRRLSHERGLTRLAAPEASI